MDKDKDKFKKTPSAPAQPAHSVEMDELYRRLQPELNRPKPNPDALAAALEAAQRLATEIDAEQSADDAAQELDDGSDVVGCLTCGYGNRRGNKFCGKCGVALKEAAEAPDHTAAKAPHTTEQPITQQSATSSLALSPEAAALPDRSGRPPATQPSGNETHHYHHHYHHHYFPGGEAMAGRSPAEAYRDAPRDSFRDNPRDTPREEKFRPTAALRGDMSRAEAAVRRIAQEWVLGCNTKHLDDLMELYTADALVLRSNCPPLRGTSAVREFFFGALDAGLGEVELEPLRVEVVGELAYEGGRFKALIPSATGKRREERGKYLWVCARQVNGEWKVTADCWSSDLTLTTLESDIPQNAAVKISAPRKP